MGAVEERVAAVREREWQAAGPRLRLVDNPVDGALPQRRQVVPLEISLRALEGVTLRSVASRDSGRERTSPRIADPVDLRCHHLPISPGSYTLKKQSRRSGRVFRRYRGCGPLGTACE